MNGLYHWIWIWWPWWPSRDTADISGTIRYDSAVASPQCHCNSGEPPRMVSVLFGEAWTRRISPESWVGLDNEWEPSLFIFFINLCVQNHWVHHWFCFKQTWVNGEPCIYATAYTLQWQHIEEKIQHWGSLN
jgi:hypothetical protein